MAEAHRPVVRATDARSAEEPPGARPPAPGQDIHPTNESLRAVAARTPWGVLLLGWIVAFATGAVLALLVKALGWWEGTAAWEVATLEMAHETVSPRLDVIMLTLPFAGTNYTLAPIVAIAAGILWSKGWTTVALHLAVVQAGSWLLNPALKFTFPRDRPTLFEARGQHAFPAFPSGHAIAVAAVLVTIAYLVHRTGHGKWGYWVVGAFFLLNSYSRVYLGVHWPTDVLAGAVVGLVWLVWTIRVFARVHRGPAV
jgi:undecaprenyl-diphosphatase